MGTLVQGTDGSLYGVTQFGGSSNNGTVFKLPRDGTLRTLVSFGNTNGAWPHAGLIQGSDGNFYGTTAVGGQFGAAPGNGTVFKLTSDGLLTTLVSFAGTNGAGPQAELVEGVDGNFYGTTGDGGRYTNQFLGIGYGTAFHLTPAGEMTVLVDFDGANGGSPYAPLTRGRNGNLYGTTRLGGSFSNLGPGTFLKLEPAGALTTLLSFDGTNSAGSLFGLVHAGDGDFYETSYGGGTNRDSNGAFLGNVLRLTSLGEATTVFCFNGTNGSFPRGLMEATDGNFYGVTGRGGPGYTGTIGSGAGTVFKLTSDGTLTTLVAFTNNELPFGGLLQADDGNLYGTTRGGGAYGQGTLFRLSVPMPAVLRSATQQAGIFTSIWSVAAAQTYQPQYCTELAKANWSNLGASFTATNGSMLISDRVGPEPQRFYRLVLLP